MRAEEVARVRTLDIEAPGWRPTARAHTFDCRDKWPRCSARCSQRRRRRVCAPMSESFFKYRGYSVARVPVAPLAPLARGAAHR